MATPASSPLPNVAGAGKVTDTQVAFMVECYLRDCNFAKTLDQFRSEAARVLQPLKSVLFSISRFSFLKFFTLYFVYVFMPACLPVSPSLIFFNLSTVLSFFRPPSYFASFLTLLLYILLSLFYFDRFMQIPKGARSLSAVLNEYVLLKEQQIEFNNERSRVQALFKGLQEIVTVYQSVSNGDQLNAIASPVPYSSSASPSSQQIGKTSIL